MYLLSLICLAMASGVFAGCGGNKKGPPFSVETAKTSPLAGIQDDTVGKPGVDPTERLRKMAESGASLVRSICCGRKLRPRDRSTRRTPRTQRTGGRRMTGSSMSPRRISWR